METQIARAKLLYETQKWEDALADYRRALSLDPKSVDACIGFGDCNIALGKPKAALIAFARALESDSGRTQAREKRAALNYSLGDYEATLQDCEAVPLALDASR